MYFFDRYGPQASPPDTAGTGLPMVFNGEGTMLFAVILALIVIGIVMILVARTRS